jgi:hypothetical protein
MEQATTAIAGRDIKHDHKSDTPVFHPTILRLMQMYPSIFFSLHLKIIFFVSSLSNKPFRTFFFPSLLTPTLIKHVRIIIPVKVQELKFPFGIHGSVHRSMTQ